MTDRPHPVCPGNYKRLTALLIAMAFSATIAVAQYRSPVEAAVAKVVGCTEAMHAMIPSLMQLEAEFLPSLGAESLEWLQAQNEFLEIQVRQAQAINDLLGALDAEGVIIRAGLRPEVCD